MSLDQLPPPPRITQRDRNESGSWSGLNTTGQGWISEDAYARRRRSVHRFRSSDTDWSMILVILICLIVAVWLFL